jgi:hypothetical protein
VCTRTWKEDRGRQREEVEKEVESECVKVWEGEREEYIEGGIENVCESVGGRQRKT